MAVSRSGRHIQFFRIGVGGKNLFCTQTDEEADMSESEDAVL